MMKSIACTWLGLALAGPAALLAQPDALKVDPPNWWAGHSLNPVRLLIRGENFQGAIVRAEGVGVRVGLTRVNAAGTYLFADLHIHPEAPPGTKAIRIESARGRDELPFEILEPLGRQGRFQGISRDDVIYLLMPDRFANADPANDDPPESPGLHDRRRARYYHGGDLEGVIQRLPYLEDLGVTAIWMNPLYDNANRLNERETYGQGPVTDYHGYGAVDFYAVDEHLGDVHLFRRLVDEAHRRGIKVIQDQVANHTGPYHPWVADPPTPTWFNGSEREHLANEWQTWTLADPRSPPEVRKPTLDGWFLDILPDLNQGDEEVARYIIQNTLWWIGMTGLDAIRQDTLPYVPRWFWRDWMTAIKREYPEVDVIGEFFEGNPSLVAFYQGGKARHDGVDTRIDTLFDFPLYYGIQSAFTRRQSVREIAKALAHDYLYTRPGMLVTFIDLHDTRRFISEPGADRGGLKMAYTLIFTARGIPLIYYGTEIGMAGGADPDNRRDFPGGWPGDERNAFSAQGRTPEEQEIFSHVRSLAHLRRETQALRRGRMVNLHVGEQTYAYARVGESSTALVAFNNGDAEVEFTFSTRPAGMHGDAALADELGGGEAIVRGGEATVKLPSRSSAVYVHRR